MIFRSSKNALQVMINLEDVQTKLRARRNDGEWHKSNLAAKRLRDFSDVWATTVPDHSTATGVSRNSSVRMYLLSQVRYGAGQMSMQRFLGNWNHSRECFLIQ
jgi:hypothetical protein